MLSYILLSKIKPVKHDCTLGNSAVLLNMCPHTFHINKGLMYWQTCLLSESHKYSKWKEKSCFYKPTKRNSEHKVAMLVYHLMNNTKDFAWLIYESGLFTFRSIKLYTVKWMTLLCYCIWYCCFILPLENLFCVMCVLVGMEFALQFVIVFILICLTLKEEKM